MLFVGEFGKNSAGNFIKYCVEKYCVECVIRTSREVVLSELRGSESLSLPLGKLPGNH